MWQQQQQQLAIDPLHYPVTWYGINYAGTQVARWDFKNKGTRTRPARLSFVLKVPLCYLRPSIIYPYHMSGSCKRLIQETLKENAAVIGHVLFRYRNIGVLDFACCSQSRLCM